MKKQKKYMPEMIIAVMLIGSFLLGGCSGTELTEADKNSSPITSGADAENRTADSAAEGLPEGTDSRLELHFIDVGQGDATLISCDGYHMLIDAGNNDKGTAVWSYLKQQGVERLDYVIGTHPDADHIGGLDVVLYKFDCGTVIMPEVENDTRTYEDVVQVLEEKDYPVTCPVVGETYSLGEASFTVIAPNKDYGTDMNDSSVGILLEHGDNRFLLTGDAEEEAEADILANGIDISADVYKAGHHGSKTASTEEFLNAVNPEYAVISCGEGNSYGHPHAEVLNRFRSMGIDVFRTDEQGTIVAVSDGREITWNCTPSESWQAGEPTGSSTGQNADNWKGGQQTEDSSKDGQDQSENVPGGEEAQEEASGSDTETTVYITKSGEKYHRADCSYLKNDVEKISLSEAKERGYEPCKKCQPLVE